MTKRESGGKHARFKGYKAPAAERVVTLAADHPAVVEGRTLFPGLVTSTRESPRFLIAGKNNAKIGAKVLKGPWAGMPIYTVTLEERKTCPRSCSQWRTCYGSSMQWPRRWDAFDPDFIPALAAEVITVGRQHPEGFVVRLHVLGDFFSTQYVLAWAHLLFLVPNLHVYGYTARRVDLDDRESQKIAAALAVLTDRMWSRFAVRTSHAEPGPGRAIVVAEDPAAPDVIICPAQTEATTSCATCGLCWAPVARGKTIAFLQHGMVRRAPSAAPGRPKAASPPPTAVDAVLIPPDRLAAARARLAEFDSILKPKEPRP